MHGEKGFCWLLEGLKGRRDDAWVILSLGRRCFKVHSRSYRAGQQRETKLVKPSYHLLAARRNGSFRNYGISSSYTRKRYQKPDLNEEDFVCRLVYVAKCRMPYNACRDAVPGILERQICVYV